MVKMKAPRGLVWFCAMVLIFGHVSEALPTSFLDFFTNHQQQQPRRQRHYGHGQQRQKIGEGRYREICRIHHVDSLAYPGAVGNPVCPY